MPNCVSVIFGPIRPVVLKCEGFALNLCNIFSKVGCVFKKSMTVMRDGAQSDFHAFARDLLGANRTWVRKTWALCGHLSRLMLKRAVSGVGG